VLTDIILEPFAKLLNRGVSQSTSAQGLCREFHDRSLLLEVTGTGFAVRFIFRDGAVQLVGNNEPADAVISGGPLSLRRLLGEEPQAPIRDGSVRISGDADVAQGFQELLRLALPDPEEELSRLIGDAAAHQVGNTVRNFANWTRHARRSVGRSLGEFLQEERRVLPTRTEVNEFYNEVDDLVLAVERVEARLKRLSAGQAASPDSGDQENPR